MIVPILSSDLTQFNYILYVALAPDAYDGFPSYRVVPTIDLSARIQVIISSCIVLLVSALVLLAYVNIDLTMLL